MMYLSQYFKIKLGFVSLWALASFAHVSEGIAMEESPTQTSTESQDQTLTQANLDKLIEEAKSNNIEAQDKLMELFYWGKGWDEGSVWLRGLKNIKDIVKGLSYWEGNWEGEPGPIGFVNWENVKDRCYDHDLYAYFFIYHCKYGDEEYFKIAPEFISHVKQRADQGQHQAQYNLGLMYLDGIGVDQNIKESLRLFRKANLWMPEKVYELPLSREPETLHEFGRLFQGVDSAKAFEYFQQAASHGLISAQYKVGCMTRYNMQGTPEQGAAAFQSVIDKVNTILQNQGDIIDPSHLDSFQDNKHDDLEQTINDLYTQANTEKNLLRFRLLSSHALGTMHYTAEINEKRNFKKAEFHLSQVIRDYQRIIRFAASLGKASDIARNRTFPLEISKNLANLCRKYWKLAYIGVDLHRAYISAANHLELCYFQGEEDDFLFEPFFLKIEGCSGIPQNFSKAFKFAKIAAEGCLDNSSLLAYDSQTRLFSMYMNDQGVPQDFNLFYFTRSNSRLRPNELLDFDSWKSFNFDVDYVLCRKESFKSNPNLQFKLGMTYLKGFKDGRGFELPRDPIKAFKFFSRAAYLGIPQAAQRCQQIHASYVQKVTEDQKVRQSQYALGRIYHYIAKSTSPFDEVKEKRSLHYLTLAAKSGFIFAHDKLARIYDKKQKKLREKRNREDDKTINNYQNLSVKLMKLTEDAGITHPVCAWSNPLLAVSLYYEELKTSFHEKKILTLKKFVTFLDMKDGAENLNQVIIDPNDYFSKTSPLRDEIALKAQIHGKTEMKPSHSLVVAELAPLYEGIRKFGYKMDKVYHDILDNVDNPMSFITCVQPTEELIKFLENNLVRGRREKYCTIKFDNQFYSCIGEMNVTTCFKVQKLFFDKVKQANSFLDKVEESLQEAKGRTDLLPEQCDQIEEEITLIPRTRQAILDGCNNLKSLVKINLPGRNQAFKEENEEFFK